jgi:REP element-mobilizing transposase RayT
MNKVVQHIIKKPSKRRSIRLKEYDYTNPNWYYVTICTNNKNCVFGRLNNGKLALNELGEVVKEEWLKTNAIRPNIKLDYFIVMPNHIHGIIIIESSRGVMHYAPTSKIHISLTNIGCDC